MKKIMIVGSPGSGKSHFSRKLAEITGISVYHMDMIYHNPDRTTNPREYLIERVREIFANDSWIIDGNYGRTLETRLKFCDTVFLLDYPVEVCLAGAKDRVGKKREEIFSSP